MLFIALIQCCDVIKSEEVDFTIQRERETTVCPLKNILLYEENGIGISKITYFRQSLLKHHKESLVTEKLRGPLHKLRV